MLDRQSGISDAEMERVTIAQSRAMLQLIDTAFGRAKAVLDDLYPGAVDDVDAAFAAGLREAVAGIEA